ncbi:hypothetical protein ISN45_Aa05g010910 [Arabidopsis thaliana x Arabidopsis arenosa]|uniref:Uncharacterized protein n=1 Tax=Arabidopsis thaliana x Arabidopsis arenosa TaxID=1240361 RepID=A0A8T1ZK02_9BRAS|nr:hypothetical protein ISN45_Aa05g010910 [Arabidopsis thaliana x Arabidopsis arenosa]
MFSDTGKSIMETTESKETETVKISYQEIFPISFFTGINIMSENMSEPTLSRTWHWSPIEGLNPEGAIRKTDHFIRQEIARMSIHPEIGISPTLRRKKGIVIGVARAVSTEMYRILPRNLTAEEMDTAKLAVGDDGDAIVIKDDVDSKWKEELSKPLNLSETEKKVIPKLHLLATGMIPLQGYSLLTVLYHYNYQSEEAFTAVEELVWAGCDQLSWWWKEDLTALRDAMWYNAGHPVKISFKKETACSNTVKQLLVEAGLGSAAAMLPFLEPEVRKAKSYITLLETVSLIFKSEGGGCNWEILSEMMAYLENFPVWMPTEIVTVNNAPTHLRSLDTRKKVVASIKECCMRNACHVALCFGFYMAMVEKGDQFQGAKNLKRFSSLMALKKTHFGYYFLGTELFLDYCAYEVKQSQVVRSWT